MEYEYVADADILAEAKQRGAQAAVSEAVMLEMEQERLERVRDTDRVPSKKAAASMQQPTVAKQAERARIKADQLIATSGLTQAEIDAVEQEVVVAAITEKEREHVYRSAEISQLQDELDVLTDPDDITALEQVIFQRLEELILVEMAHEVLIERRDA